MLGYWSRPRRHGRSSARRLAAHRRPGHARRRGLPDDHEAQEGADRNGRRQEYRAGGRSKPAHAGSAHRPWRMIGDGRNYLDALIVPNFDLLREEVAKHQEARPMEGLPQAVFRRGAARAAAGGATVPAADRPAARRRAAP